MYKGELFVGAGLTTSHADARLPSWMRAVRGVRGCQVAARAGGPVVGNVEGLGGRKPGASMGEAQEGRGECIFLAHKKELVPMGQLQI